MLRRPWRVHVRASRSTDRRGRPAPPARSSATTRRGPSSFGDGDSDVASHGARSASPTGSPIKAEHAGGDTVNVTIADASGIDPRRLLPLAARARPTRPSAARSATCGTRTATATRARCPTPSTTAAPTTAAACTRNSGVVEPRLRAARRRRHLQRRDASPASASTKAAQSSGAPRRPTSTPTSDFADLADGARGVVRRPDRGGASTRCSAPSRRTSRSPAELITAADCAAVDGGHRGGRAAHGARRSATSSRCSPGTRRAPVASGFRTVNVFKETFEDGSAQTGRRRQQVVFDGGRGFPWRADRRRSRPRRAGLPTAPPRTRVTAPGAPATSPSSNAITSPAIGDAERATAPTPRPSSTTSPPRRACDGGNVKIKRQRRARSRSSRPRRTSSTRRRP